MPWLPAPWPLPGPDSSPAASLRVGRPSLPEPHRPPRQARARPRQHGGARRGQFACRSAAGPGQGNRPGPSQRPGATPRLKQRPPKRSWCTGVPTLGVLPFCVRERPPGLRLQLAREALRVRGDRPGVLHDLRHCAHPSECLATRRAHRAPAACLEGRFQLLRIDRRPAEQAVFVQRLRLGALRLGSRERGEMQEVLHALTHRRELLRRRHVAVPVRAGEFRPEGEVAQLHEQPALPFADRAAAVQQHPGIGRNRHRGSRCRPGVDHRHAPHHGSGSRRDSRDRAARP